MGEVMCPSNGFRSHQTLLLCGYKMAILWLHNYILRLFSLRVDKTTPHFPYYFCKSSIVEFDGYTSIHPSNLVKRVF
jgi:hypothetical protein